MNDSTYINRIEDRVVNHFQSQVSDLELQAQRAADALYTLRGILQIPLNEESHVKQKPLRSSGYNQFVIPTGEKDSTINVLESMIDKTPSGAYFTSANLIAPLVNANKHLPAGIMHNRVTQGVSNLQKKGVIRRVGRSLNSNGKPGYHNIYVKTTCKKVCGCPATDKGSL